MNMKYKRTEKEGFMKAWMQQFLETWYLHLVSAFLLLSAVVLYANASEYIKAGFSVQSIMFAFFMILFFKYMIIDYMLRKVLNNMVEEGYLVKIEKIKGRK